MLRGRRRGGADYPQSVPPRITHPPSPFALGIRKIANSDLYVSTQIIFSSVHTIERITYPPSPFALGIRKIANSDLSVSSQIITPASPFALCINQCEEELRLVCEF